MYQQNEKSKSELKVCLKAVVERIETSSLKNCELIEICKSYADFFGGDNDPHICHEIAETALNSVIKTKLAKKSLLASNPAVVVADILKPLAARLPTQTWRSHEQNIRQQFSTPPAMAYLLSYLLNFQQGEQVLEPSAGTGGLAVWSNGFGIETHVNEIDPRRRDLLCELGFAPTSHNAEFIDDFLTHGVEIDCVMMNPPFSANGERTRFNSCKFGFRHVESALRRLKRGGKFGIILGNSAGLDTKTGDEFWRKMSVQTSVRAIIKISGREYYKNGTSVETNLIVGRKNQSETPLDWNQAKSRIINVSAGSVEDAFALADKSNLRLN